jgi:hypothetical protein
MFLVLILKIPVFILFPIFKALQEKLQKQYKAVFTIMEQLLARLYLPHDRTPDYHVPFSLGTRGLTQKKRKKGKQGTKRNDV